MSRSFPQPVPRQPCSGNLALFRSNAICFMDRAIVMFSWRFKSLMLRINRLIAILGMVVLFATAPCESWAGWNYKETTTYSLGKQKTPSRSKANIYWQGLKLRRENSDGSIEIFRLDQNLYWEIEPSSKSYRQMALVPVAEGTGELPRELDEALAQLSHEERQLLEKYLPSRAASRAAESLKITVGIEMEMISGLLCQKIRAQYRNLTSILWVTDQLPIGPEEYAFYTELAKRTLHREGMEDWYLWAEVLSRTGGFAMKQENALQSAAGTIKTIVVVENIVEKSVPETFFRLPAGLHVEDE